MPGVIWPAKCPRCLKDGAFLGEHKDKTCWYCSEWKMSGTCHHCGLVICEGCVQKATAPQKPERQQQEPPPPLFGSGESI